MISHIIKHVDCNKEKATFIYLVNKTDVYLMPTWSEIGS